MASDMRGIVGNIGNPSATSQKRQKTTKVKRPEGMSREVFALIEGHSKPGVKSPVASIMPSVKVKKQFQKKRKVVKKVPWVWKGFTNSGRSDGAVFHHWERANVTYPDYVFAKYNKKTQLMRYTEEQYETYFKDPEWTREETDHLFDLCESFDLRFPVIVDRFASRYPNKSIEDLRDRYHTIYRKLLELSGSLSQEELSNHPLYQMKYDKEYEKKRKRQAERLYNRTAREFHEERDLLEQLKRIEKEDQKQKERDQQRANKLMQIAKSTPKRTYREFIKHLEEQQAASMLPKKRVRGARKRSPTDLRSATLVLGQRMSKKVDVVLKELGWNAIPIGEGNAVQRGWEELKQDCVLLLDLHAHVNKKEYELAVYRKRHELLSTVKTKLQQVASKEKQLHLYSDNEGKKQLD